MVFQKAEDEQGSIAGSETYAAIPLRRSRNEVCYDLWVLDQAAARRAARRFCFDYWAVGFADTRR